jgi:hypothetical protein
MEFVNSKFLYAVEVDTSQGFELCPADACEIESNCPTEDFNKFKINGNFSIPNISDFENFLRGNDIGIAGIEIIFDENGSCWTYDVNTNTNYNSKAEEQADQNAPEAVARFLGALSK